MCQGDQKCYIDVTLYSILYSVSLRIYVNIIKWQVSSFRFSCVVMNIVKKTVCEYLICVDARFVLYSKINVTDRAYILGIL